MYSFRNSSQSLGFLDVMYSSKLSTGIGKRGFGGGLVTAGLLMRPFSGYLASTVVVSNTSNISDVITEIQHRHAILICITFVFCFLNFYFLCIKQKISISKSIPPTFITATSCESKLTKWLHRCHTRSFSRICQVAPMCRPSCVWLLGPTTVFPAKGNLDLFLHFCRAHQCAQHICICISSAAIGHINAMHLIIQ